VIEIEKSELARGPSRRDWLVFGALAVVLVLGAAALGVGLSIAQGWLRGVLS
jgi:hypothetical protein